MGEARRTLVLVNLASIMERADEALLPAVYREVGEALHATPTGLGALTLCRSFVQATCYPLAACAAVRYDRARVVALGAFLWAAATFLVAVSDNFAQKAALPQSAWREMKDLVVEAKAVVKIPSFQIIVAQGITGSFPWSALSFAPMWLELMGFTHKGTGILMITSAVASSLGGLLGGKMGDYLARRYPNSGRIVISQISSASAIPLAALLLLGLPDDPSTGFMHGLVMFIVGFSISWNAPATNNPIFAEIVPERSRTSIYALDRSFESVFASFAPPIVGYLAEHAYGYNPITYGASVNSVTRDRKNAAALAKALYTAIAIPMLLCCFIYSLLYQTYPRDRERARMDTLITSELQQIELERSQGARDYYRRENVAVIDFENGNEGLDVDDDDDKTLMRYEVEQSAAMK